MRLRLLESIGLAAAITAVPLVFQAGAGGHEDNITDFVGVEANPLP